MAILFMSWPALVLNVAWQEDPETLPGPKRLHSERFWTQNDRAFARGVRWILIRGSMLGILGLTIFYAFALPQQLGRPFSLSKFYNGATVFNMWLHETPELTSNLIYLIGCYCKITLNIMVPVLLWLQARDSEATPGGLTFAIQGFVASILFTAYRIYHQVNVDTFVDEPVSPVVLLALTIMRYLLLRYSQTGAWTRAARVSRIALLVLWVLLTIVAPAFVLTAVQLAPESCAVQAKNDPIWTPSF